MSLEWIVFLITRKLPLNVTSFLFVYFQVKPKKFSRISEMSSKKELMHQRNLKSLLIHWLCAHALPLDFKSWDLCFQMKPCFWKHKLMFPYFKNIYSKLKHSLSHKMLKVLMPPKKLTKLQLMQVKNLVMEKHQN